MKRVFLFLCLGAALLALACKKTENPAITGDTSPKPPKRNAVIVVIDIDRILKETKLSQQITLELQAWGEGMKNQMQAKIAVFQQRQEALKASGQSMPPAVRNAKIQELQSLQAEIQQMQSQAQQELERRQEAAAKKMRDQFDPMMDAIAKQNGWDVILNKADQVTVWSAGVMDQTDYVIKRLNSMQPIVAPQAPAPAGGAQPPAAGSK